MRGAIWVVAWPVLCESLLNSTVGLVDTTIASHISQSAADAVGGGAYFTWFIGLITMAIGVGATALMARSIGAGKNAVAKATLGQAMLLAAVGGVAVAAGLLLLGDTLAGLLSLRGEAALDVKRYLSAYALGVPFSTILFAGSACARGAGDTMRPLLTMVVVNIVNLLAVWVLAHNLDLGTRGIGLGTAIAHTVGAVMICAFHFRGAAGVRLETRWLRPHAVTMWRLLRLGMPNFLETFGMWVANMGIVVMVGWMGAAAVARGASAAVGESGGMLGAHVLAIRIEALSFLPGFSMGIAASALTGQYLGAGAPVFARRAALTCAAWGAIMMGLMGVVFVFFGSTLVSLLSEQPAHLLLTPELLLVTGLVQVPFAYAIVLRSAMHGAGDVRAVMLMTWISQWGLRLPLAYAISGVRVPLPAFLANGESGTFLQNPFGEGYGLKGLWIGLCTEIVLRCGIYAWRFRHGGWLKAKV